MRPETAQLLEELLAWDARRVARRKRENPGRSYRDYEERQERAGAMLRGTPARAWPHDIRRHFRILLEHTGEAALLPRAERTTFEGDPSVPRGWAHSHRLKRPRNLERPPVGATAAAVLQAAADIGVLEVLQSAGASVWRGGA